MKQTRIVVTHYGGPEELRLVEEEHPEPKHGEVRVRVLAAGVSLPDVMMREGVHPETPRLPFTPLIHGASGGVGTALLQLGRLAGLEMYGTCSSRGAPAVSELGGIPIDYQHQDFVSEVHRLRSPGVDVVFDSNGGHAHLAFAEGSASRRESRGLYIAAGWLLPDRKRVVPYSIQPSTAEDQAADRAAIPARRSETRTRVAREGRRDRQDRARARRVVA